MPTYQNNAPFDFEFPGEGEGGRALLVVAAGETTDVFESNPFEPYFTDVDDPPPGLRQADQPEEEEPTPAETPAAEEEAS